MRSKLCLSTFLAVTLAASGALAQSAGGAGGGMDSNSRSMSGPNIDVDNGIMANGTPKQQSPGVSMTNGPANTGGATLNGDGAPQAGGAAALPAPGGPAPAVSAPNSGQ